MNEDLMLIEDAAPYVGHKEATVREWCRLGTFPHRKLPNKRRILVSRREVDAWLDGAELEVKRLAGDGRIVRTKKPAGKRAA